MVYRITVNGIGRGHASSKADADRLAKRMIVLYGRGAAIRIEAVK